MSPHPPARAPLLARIALFGPRPSIGGGPVLSASAAAGGAWMAAAVAPAAGPAAGAPTAVAGGDAHRVRTREPLFQAVLGPAETRALALALRLLFKVHAECTLELRPEGMALRALNSAQSAYAKVFLPPLLFTQYTARPPPAGDTILLGLALKTLLHALRMFQAAEEAVLTYFEPEVGFADRLFLRMLTRDGVQREYGMPLIARTEAAVETGSSLNDMTAVLEVRSKEFNRVQMASFSGAVSELTLCARVEPSIAGGAEVVMRSHAEANSQAGSMLGTELSLHGDDESVLEIRCQQGVQAEATCALRELKAMLAFCEAVGMDAAIGFDTPGKPLVVTPRQRPGGASGSSVAGCHGFQAQLVLSSLLQSMLGGARPGTTSTRDGSTPHRSGASGHSADRARLPTTTTPAASSGPSSRSGELLLGSVTQAGANALVALGQQSAGLVTAGGATQGRHSRSGASVSAATTPGAEPLHNGAPGRAAGNGVVPHQPCAQAQPDYELSDDEVVPCSIDPSVPTRGNGGDVRQFETDDFVARSPGR